MAIRIKNLDLESAGMKRHSLVNLGDISAGATHYRTIFSAPIACVVNHVDFYSKEGVPTAVNCASLSVVTIAVRLGTASGSTLQTRGTSANGVSNSDNIPSGTRYRLNPSANNSLTSGTPIEVAISAGCAALSAVLCVVTYTPLLHRENI